MGLVLYSQAPLSYALGIKAANYQLLQYFSDSYYFYREFRVASIRILFWSYLASFEPIPWVHRCYFFGSSAELHPVPSKGQPLGS
jgi:hypothetical protein